MDQLRLTQAVASLTRRARPRLAAEAGFGLIEVMVSAALLVICVLALTAGIDGPAQTAARNQQRTVGATLAQQDQDRMRGMRTSDLADYSPAPRQVNVGGVNYTVTSRGTWYRDQSGSASCINNSAVVQYIDITSTVTWPAMRGPAVTQESLVAPKNGAFNLIAQISDEKGNPVNGLPITTSQTAGVTRNTNSFGCAVFGHMPAGPYTLSFSKQGWVDPAGVNNVQIGATVANNSTTTVSHSYAAGATINVNFDSVDKNGNAVAGVQGRSITIANSGLPSGTMTFPTAGPGTAVNSITTPLVYPFQSGYGVYAGNCASNNPASSPNTGTTPTVQTPYASNPSVTVREPMVNLLVKKGVSAVAGAHVTIAPTGAGCTETYPAQTAGSGASAGVVAYPLPFGTYSVCADDAKGAASHKVTATVNNTNPNGTATQTLTIGATTGTCP